MSAVAAYQIRLFGDPVLTQRAAEVTEIDASLGRLVEDMLETMYEARGLGLAAPQVGVQKRLFVYQMEDRDPVAIVNPVIAESRGEWEFDEGCLSIPDIHEDVERPALVKIRYLDLDGKAWEAEADGLFATCIQHEVDHLNGVLFIDHISKLKRDRINKKFIKAAKRAEEEED